MMHALILSDLHLGARNSQHHLILQRLGARLLRDVTHIILNGDVVDHLNFESFRPHDWKVIRRLRQLAQEDRLVVVQGNHDQPKRAGVGCFSRQVLGDVLDVELKTELTMYVDGLRYLLVHGDKYDQTLNMSTLGTVAEAIYRQTQRWHQPTSRWLKRQSKNVLGIERRVRQLAVADARRRGFDGIILGHTHYAHDEVHDDGVRYVNSGSWVDDVCSYIEVRDDRMEVCHWYGEELVKTQEVEWEKPEPAGLIAPVLSY